MTNIADLKIRYQRLLTELYEGLQKGLVELKLSVLYGDGTITNIAGLRPPIWRNEGGQGYQVTPTDLLVFSNEGFLTEHKSPQPGQRDFLVNITRIQSAVDTWSSGDTQVDELVNGNMTNGSTSPVFICYSHYDMDFVTQLDQELQEQGIVTWRDKKDIPEYIKTKSAEWDDAVAEGLRLSGMMLVIVSPKSMNSREVKNEIQDFIEEKKPIFVVMRCECKVYHRINRSERFFLNRDYKGELVRLVNILSGTDSSPGMPPSDRTRYIKQLLNSDDRIELEQYIRSLVNQTYQAFHNDQFYSERQQLIDQPDITNEQQWIDCIRLYFVTCEEALHVLATLCWYGEDNSAELVRYAVKRWIEEPEGNEQFVTWRYYPSLLLIYIASMVALHKSKWAYLSAAFNQQLTSVPGRRERTSVIALIIDKTFVLHYERVGRRSGIVPKSIGGVIQPLLYSVFQLLGLSQKEFDNMFDLFESIFSLFYFTIPERQMAILPSVEFPYPEQRSSDYVFDFWEQGGRQGQAWGLLGTGLVASKPDHLEKILYEYQETLNKVYHSAYFRMFSGPPNYAALYRKGLDDA